MSLIAAAGLPTSHGRFDPAEPAALDWRIIRRILHRRNRLRLRFCRDRRRGQRAHHQLRRSATGKEQWQKEERFMH